MIFTAPTGGTLPALLAWAQRFTSDLNQFHMSPNRWPTFADDTAAAAGRLKVGDPYVTPTGEMRRRVA